MNPTILTVSNRYYIVPTPEPDPIMPTILGYTTTPASNAITGVPSMARPGISHVKLTNETYIGVAVRDLPSAGTVYVHGIEWTGSSPMVNNFVSSAGSYQRVSRTGGLAVIRLNDTQAIGLYQSSTSTNINAQFFTYEGGPTVTVDSTVTVTGTRGFVSGRGINFHTSGSVHYIALAGCNRPDGNYDGHINFLKVDESAYTVTYITKGQIHTGADNSADVECYGLVDTDTYGFLGVCHRNTSFNGPIAYATMKFDVATETLTVSSNLNTLDANSCVPLFTARSMVKIDDNKILHIRRRATGGDVYQACISYDGTTTTVENNSLESTGNLFPNGGLTRYLLDGYQTPEYQIINAYELQSVDRSLRVETLVFNSASNAYTRSGDSTYVEPSGATGVNGVYGVFVLLKDVDNGMVIWSDNVGDSIDWNTFEISGSGSV
jgi:hypothetical protein